MRSISSISSIIATRISMFFSIMKFLNNTLTTLLFIYILHYFTGDFSGVVLTSAGWLYSFAAVSYIIFSISSSVVVYSNFDQRVYLYHEASQEDAIDQAKSDKCKGVPLLACLFNHIFVVIIVALFYLFIGKYSQTWNWQQQLSGWVIMIFGSWALTRFVITTSLVYYTTKYNDPTFLPRLTKEQFESYTYARLDNYGIDHFAYLPPLTKEEARENAHAWLDKHKFNDKYARYWITLFGTAIAIMYVFDIPSYL